MVIGDLPAIDYIFILFFELQKSANHFNLTTDTVFVLQL